MKLVHLKMKRPENDISLSDGELFMVKHRPYVEHLEHGPQSQPVGNWIDWRFLCCWLRSRNQCAIIIMHKIMEIWIGTIWMPWGRVHVHVLDMGPLSLIVSRTSKSRFANPIISYQFINSALDRLIWITQFAKCWTDFPNILGPSSYMIYAVNG